MMPIEDDRAVSLMSEESRRARELLREVGQQEEQDQLKVIQEIGRLIHESDVGTFKVILKEHILSGTIDVTEWRRHSVKVLLEICAEGSLNVHRSSVQSFHTICTPRVCADVY